MDKLILVGQNLSSLSVVKYFIQQHYDAFAFNLKNITLPLKAGRILNISDLCAQFPDVVLVQDDSGKTSVVGLADKVDSCIMTLTRGTRTCFKDGCREHTDNTGQ